MPVRVLFARPLFVIASLIAVGVAGCGGGGTPATETDALSHTTTRSAEQHHGSPAPANQIHGSVKMSGNPSCELPGGSEYFLPETNLWRADTQHRTTIVCAGGASSDKPGAGRFLIIRAGSHWPNGRQGVQGIDQVTIPGVGPIKITKAPLGPHAATRAQTDGSIEFRAHDGTTGTLHLSDDTVTLNR